MSVAHLAVFPLTILLAFSGCSGKGPATPAQVPDPPCVPGMAEDGSEHSWRFVRANRSGAADTGVFLFHPFDAPLRNVELRRNITISSSSPTEAAQVFFLEPQPLPMRLDKQGVYFWVQPRWFWDQERFDWSAADEQSDATVGSLGGNDNLGVFMAFASTAPWTLSFEYELVGSLGCIVEPRVLEASPAKVVRASAIVPVAQNANAFNFQVALDQPGFFHYQIARQPAPAYGARYFEVSFPDGYACRDPQAEYPLGPGPLAAGSTSRIDYAGSFRSPAGDFAARMGYADTSTKLDMSLLHVALDPEKLPEFFQAHYVGPRYGTVAARTGC